MEMIFAQRMLELRRKKGVSQKEAAENLGVSQALLSHYEKGIRECGLDFLARASAYYDVSSDYLIGISDTGHTVHEEFDRQDIKSDSEFRTSTLFRAAAMLDAFFENLGVGKRDLIKNYFAVSIYSLSVLAVRSGNIPKSWISYPLDNASAMAKAMTEIISRSIVSDSDPKKSKKPIEPQCVKTVIDEAEKIIRKNALVITQTPSE
ncbi:MAG: helix-turn-helix transcriptional regulator [Ruminococcaceae bacterium]|nr:helix-turn-helix transcriptional regulator [Oscillospiraceae bacterium]